MSASPVGRPILGIIASQFPELHETFIVRELQALRDAGITLHIYSLKRCHDDIVHPEAESLVGCTTYLPWDDVSLWASAVKEFVRHPIRGVVTFGWTVRYHLWPMAALGKAMVAWIQALAVVQRMREDGIAHLHAHWATLPTTVAVIASRWLSIPFSFTAHAWDIFVHNPSLKTKMRLAERIITCTAYNRRFLTSVCPEAREKIALNYHGVDVKRFAGSRVREFAGSDSYPPTRQPANPPTPLLLSVGRLVETKGFDVLLEAYRQLRAKGVAFRAVIVGKGPFRRSLQRQIRSSGLADLVELKVPMGQDELRRLYASAYAFVLPSVVANNGDRDGLPNVILEAMAMGLPVVSTEVSGIPEAVEDKRTGLLVPPRDPQRLADALERLLQRPLLARMFGDHAWQLARTKFDAREHMGRIVTQMRGLLEAATGQGSTMKKAANGRPLTVMYVIWSLEVGGAERVVTSLAEGIDRHRFSPIVICLNGEGRLAGTLRGHDIPVVALHKRPGIDLRMLWRLVRIMRRLRPEVVHTHLWGGNVWGRVAARLTGVPVVIATEHNVDVWKRTFQFVIDRFLARWTTQLVAVSGQVRHLYESHHVGRGRWQVVYNGVDVMAVKPRGRAAAYGALGIKPGEPVVGLVARLVPAKAPGVFVEAVDRAMREIPSLKALIVGDGPLREQLGEEIRRRGLERRVILTGIREDVPELLAGMDVLAFSSQREGFPMAMLEGMAAGVPIVATRVGGTPELVESGVTGLLVPPQEPQELADSLVTLLNDPAKAGAIRRAARERVTKYFSLAQMITTHERLYSNPPTRQPANPPPSTPTRVVYVIDHLGLGGAQRQLVALVKRLSKEGYEPHVVSLSTQRVAYVDELRGADIPVTLIAHSGPWSWRTFWALYRQVRQTNPAIVHTWLFTAGLYGRLAACLCRVENFFRSGGYGRQARLARTPHMVHAIRSPIDKMPRHHRRIDRWLERCTSAITINAKATWLGLVKEDRVPSQKIRLIRNGIDLAACAGPSQNGQYRAQWRVPPRGRIVCMVARFSLEKDHRTFLEAARAVIRELPNTYFLLVGDGPTRSDVERWVEELGLSDRVRSIGQREDVRTLLHHIDVSVLSTRYEGSPNVVMEAMAAGRPVVATKVGGNVELIVDGRTGWLVPEGDSNALAQRVVELLRDGKQATAMGIRGRVRIAEHFSLDATVTNTRSLYQELLASGRRC